LHQNRVDFPELWHCIIASLHQNRVDFPGRTNNFNELQIVANAKKPRGPEDIRRRDTGASRARHHGFGLLLHVKQRDCTHHRNCHHHPRFERRRLTAKREREGHRQTYHHTAPGGRASQEHR
jgi:hypothetical protein